MTTSIRRKSLEILLVEDNPGDVRLTREALEEAESIARLNVVDDGVKALAYLRRQGPYEDSPRPNLVILDLNLPRLSGREVLQEIKSDPALLTIPVVVLSSSQAEQDITAAYRLHANCFVSKPTDLDEFVDVIRCIDTFWSSYAHLPSGG